MLHNKLLRTPLGKYTMGGIRVPVFFSWWGGKFNLLTENTCSEYRIPPQNTPEEEHKKHINIEDERYNKFNIVRLCVFCALLRGYYGV